MDKNTICDWLTSHFLLASAHKYVQCCRGQGHHGPHLICSQVDKGWHLADYQVCDEPTTDCCLSDDPCEYCLRVEKVSRDGARELIRDRWTCPVGWQEVV